MYYYVSLGICVTFYAGKCILGLSNNIESVCINLVSISYRDDHIHTNGIRPKSKMDACNFNDFFSSLNLVNSKAQFCYSVQKKMYNFMYGIGIRIRILFDAIITCVTECRRMPIDDVWKIDRKDTYLK